MKHLRHMVVFKQIVEAGSISAAALDLNISKSVVSQQLNTLEEELGVVLLKRTTRRQVLTPVGKAFYAQCKQILKMTQEAWDQARAGQAEPSGMIAINAPHALVDFIVSPAVAGLSQKFDKIIPTIHANDQRTHLLEDGIDLAVRVGESSSSEYRQRLLGHFRDVLCAAPEYLQKENFSQGKLEGQPELSLSLNYVVNAWQGKTNEYILTHKGNGHPMKLGFQANRFTDSLGAVIGLIRAGAGIGLIPDFIFESYRQQKQLVAICPDYELPKVPVYSIHAFGKNPPSTVRWAIEFLKKEMDKRASPPS